jgi:hypothetical protein
VYPLPFLTWTGTGHDRRSKQTGPESLRDQVMNRAWTFGQGLLRVSGNLNPMPEPQQTRFAGYRRYGWGKAPPDPDAEQGRRPPSRVHARTPADPLRGLLGPLVKPAPVQSAAVRSDQRFSWLLVRKRFHLCSGPRSGSAMIHVHNFQEEVFLEYEKIPVM